MGKLQNLNIVLRIFAVTCSVVISVLFQSCAHPAHPDADRLCNCYTDMYRANQEKIDEKADSCSAIHIEILNKLKGNPEEKMKFEEAYAVCQ